jgi:fatty acid desaturase
VISTSDIQTLRAELVSGGVFKHRTGASWLKFAAMLAVLAACLTATVMLPWWCALFLIPLGAIPAMTAAMIGHEAAHGSFASGKLHNEIMLHIAFPLFAGLGAQHWKNKHNHRHHGHPNVVGQDHDIELWPMATSSLQHQEAGRFRRWWQRNFQGYLFWPLNLLLAYVMRLASWTQIVGRIRAGRVDRMLLVDIGCLVAHYTLWLVVPSFVFGLLPTVLLYVGLWSIVGLLLGLVFAPAHMGLPIVGPKSAGAKGDGWLHQLETTRNLVMPRWMSWFFVGLDHQVEHHLFPRIPHQEVRRARHITRAWCERVGAPHQEIGYGAAIVDVTRFMFAGWRLDPIDRSEPVQSDAAMPSRGSAVNTSGVAMPSHGSSAAVRNSAL